VKVTRNFSIFVQYLLDEWIPPRIRDSKLFMTIPMKLVLGDSSHDFMTFKDWVFSSNQKDISDLYIRTNSVQRLQGETDLNKKCTDEIVRTISGKTVLEVGCGRGYLANLISDNHDITACDIIIPKKLKKQFPKINFIEGDIQLLPFANKSFDTVISTHTLEHVRDLPRAISELRRVAKKELIIVVPRQRPYKYTFSLHTQFFPYKWSITDSFGYKDGVTIKKLGDWFYHESIKE